MKNSVEQGNLQEEGTKLKKLTNWNQAPSVSDLKKDFEAAQSDHASQVLKIDTWLTNLEARNIQTKKGRSAVQPKLIRKQAEWRYSALSEPFLSNDDLFEVSPVTFEDTQAAYQNGLILNKQFRIDIDRVKFVNDYVRTAVNEGTVIVRVGWESQEEEVTKEVPEYTYRQASTQEELALLNEVMQYAQSNPAMLDQYPYMRESYDRTEESGLPIIATPTGNTIEVTEIETVVNKPVVQVCDYRNVIIDPTCDGDIEKANFVIYAFETSKAQLKQAGIYKNLNNIKTTSSEDPSASANYTRTNGSSFEFDDEARKKLVAYEYWGYWDIHGDGTVVPIVATWVNNTLIRLEENPFPDQAIPFVAVSYLPIRGSAYGEPDGELLEDNQKIIGAVTRGMIDLMGRSANSQIGYRKDALDAINKRKFDRGDDYEFNPSVDPRQAFYMHQYPEIPASAQFMLQLQNADAESLTGIKAFSSGISGQALGNTATGIRSALDATSKRELDILRRLARGIEKIGRKIVCMNAAWLSDEEIIRVTNEGFVSIKRDNLVGKIDLKLAISTPESDEQKAQELAFMLQTTAQSMGPEFTRLILSDIAKLRKMPELAKKIQDFQPQPDPLAQRKAELEIALLEAQIANERAKGFKQGRSGELDAARAQTELAKVRNLSSDADLKDLEFVERESGTKQAQELQRIDANAESQARLAEFSNRIKTLDSQTKTTNGLRPE